MSKNIMVLDDEDNIRLSVKYCLEPEGYQVSGFSDHMKAFRSISIDSFDLLILDIRLKEYSGIKFFEKMKREQINLPVIFISGNASLQEAAEASGMGAFDFIEKPFSSEKLLLTVKNCLEYYALKEQLYALKHTHNVRFIGNSKNIQQLKAQIGKVAKADTTVLIRGESGTGKELIAQLIHLNSERKSGEFVKVNCSAIPDNLIETELFGHVKGAFTDAKTDKKGLFELADGGTIFLDEIGDMSLIAQSKVLRVLQNNEIQKVGAEQTNKIDTRVVAATHKDLNMLIEQGEFREDLFYRINVIPLQSIPLREHPSDIPAMVKYFIENFCERYGFRHRSIEKNCMRALKEYHWPGNARELANIVERLVIMGDNTIQLSDLPVEIRQSKIKELKNDDISLKIFRETVERDFILKVLRKQKGNISSTAKALDIDRTYLYKKLRLYNIKKSEYFD